MDISNMTNEEIAKITATKAFSMVKCGEWDLSTFTTWYNAVNHVTYSEGYNDGVCVAHNK